MVFLLTRVVNRGRFFEEGGQQRALSFRRGRSTEGAQFSKRAVNRGRFFEEGGQQRALFRRGRSTEAAFSKRTINRGREGSTAANRKRPLLRRAIFLRARAVKVRPALLAERAVRSRALLFMRTPVRRALSQLP